MLMTDKDRYFDELLALWGKIDMNFHIKINELLENNNDPVKLLQYLSAWQIYINIQNQLGKKK